MIVGNKTDIVVFISRCNSLYKFWKADNGCSLFQPIEVTIEDESKLTLHGLQQYYLNVEEKEKSRKLCDLLDQLDFNQVLSNIFLHFSSN